MTQQSQQDSLLEDDTEMTPMTQQDDGPGTSSAITSSQPSNLHQIYSSIIYLQIIFSNFPVVTPSKRKKADRLELLDHSGTVRKRGNDNRKIIRFRHYGKHMDPENYYREQLMLFRPWRDEEAELINVNPIELATLYRQQLKDNSSPFYANHDIDDDLLNQLADDMEAHELGDEDDNEFIGDEQDVLEDEEYRESGFADASIDPKARVMRFLPPRMIEDSEYLTMMRSLNERQRRFVLNTLHNLKVGKVPFHNFLSGGAGVGKSHVITAMVQSYMRYRNK